MLMFVHVISLCTTTRVLTRSKTRTNPNDDDDENHDELLGRFLPRRSSRRPNECTFLFLWESSKQTEFHLCDWQTLELAARIARGCSCNGFFSGKQNRSAIGIRGLLFAACLASISFKLAENFFTDLTTSIESHLYSIQTEKRNALVFLEEAYQS